MSPKDSGYDQWIRISLECCPPYFLDMAWYATQADRFGTSRRLPMTGKGGGPGGYGSPLRLLWSRKVMNR
jgi:hypothetical protein